MNSVQSGAKGVNGYSQQFVMPLTGNDIIDSITPMELEGNILHHSWFEHEKLKFTAASRPKKGEAAPERKRAATTNLLALVVLSDIIYWYRAVIVRDPETGRMTGVRQKFRGDLLEYNYVKRAEYFGVSDRQLRDAITFLEKAGLITRTIKRPPTRVFIAP